ncbi:hypothetical protein D3C85_1102330 [compost metagenome]
MKKLNKTSKTLDLKKETVSKLTVNSRKDEFTLFPTTSKLCFDIAVLTTTF